MEVLFEKKPRSALRRTIARLVAVLPIQQRRSLRFFAVHRRFPRIRNPRTFNEKINWRVLRDRRPELAWTCDKLAAKRRVSEVCPSVRIPETYWHGTDLAELATVDLPDEWVLKPNGGCGLVLMGDGSVDATRIAELVQLTDGWLDQDLAGSTGEWAYSQCERCLFVEEKVGTGDATAPPVNFKASVFDGEVHRWGMVQWNGTEWCISYFSPEWQPLGVSNSGFPNCHESTRRSKTHPPPSFLRSKS
jgi:hypothetical protein